MQQIQNRLFPTCNAIKMCIMCHKAFYWLWFRVSEFVGNWQIFRTQLCGWHANSVRILLHNQTHSVITKRRWQLAVRHHFSLPEKRIKGHINCSKVLFRVWMITTMNGKNMKTYDFKMVFWTTCKLHTCKLFMSWICTRIFFGVVLVLNIDMSEMIPYYHLQTIHN